MVTTWFLTIWFVLENQNEEIWVKISDAFDGEPLGELDVKGKGRVSAYSIQKVKT